jgi:hypothetical protein|tara:strand:- start:102 stop:323 length:222 start_codon:yes stop_codon:yes gene_type:complete
MISLLKSLLTPLMKLINTSGLAVFVGGFIANIWNSITDWSPFSVEDNESYTKAFIGFVFGALITCYAIKKFKL